MSSKYCKFNDDEHIEFCFSGQIPDKCEYKDCYNHKMKWHKTYQRLITITLIVLIFSISATSVFNFPYISLSSLSLSLGTFLSFGSFSRLNGFTKALCTAFKSDNFSKYMRNYIVKHSLYSVLFAIIIMIILILVKLFVLPIIHK